jgi:peptide/nickel transport system ATP-binding protein
MTGNTTKPLLKVENLTVRFPVKRGGLFSKKSYLYAVDDISFEIARGETLAIVGESGSGKSTAALAVARLVEAHSGSVLLGDHDFLSFQDEALRQARAQVQCKR